MINKIFLKIRTGLTLARHLAPSTFDRLIFLFVFFVMPVWNLFKLPVMGIKIPITYNNNRKFITVWSSTDFAILREIFIEKEYEIHTSKTPKNIIDLGANTGLSVIYWKLLYPDAKIEAYEPDPITFKKLKKNVSNLNKVIVFNEAVGGSGGNKEFFINTKSNISSSFIKRDNFSEKILVPTISLDDAIQRIGENVDLLKYDIEGAEYEMFQSSKNKNSIQVIIGEFHQDLTHMSIKEYTSLFEGFRELIKKMSDSRSIIELIK